MQAERFSPTLSAVNGFLYGGDYNPEQWPESTWEEDVALMKRAGVNIVTLGVFSWALIEPQEGAFDFSRMDKVMDLLAASGIKVDLATATAAQPAWATLAYPDIAPVDDRGMRYSHGSRQTYCPNSPSYRRLADELVRKVAARYAKHPALALWHVNNEVACHLQVCTCPSCAARFREWLRSRYGSVDRLNEAWGTAFWSQRYSTWDEIVPPRVSTTNLNPAAKLDYRRFMSDSFLGVLRAESAILRELSPSTPITTNLMWTDGAEWFKLRGAVDCLAYDSYPDPFEPDSWRWASFMFDLTRGHLGGLPWLLMEQAPSHVNWRGINGAKEPGLMRLMSMQALAHGSDSALFFQWRASARGSEQFHSGMLPHAGPDSRVFREVESLGAELASLSRSDGSLPRLPGSVVKPRVALIYSYDSWWFSQYRPFPTEAFDYQRLVRDWYESLERLHVGVDIVSPEDPLDGYSLVLAPALILADQALIARLRDYVEKGGVLLAGPAAGIVDEEACVRAGGYGGDLAALCGLKIEEFDVEPADPRIRPLRVLSQAEPALAGPAHVWYDLAETLPGSEALALYSGDVWFEGRVAASRNRSGRGAAFWLGTRPEAEWLDAFLTSVLREARVESPISASASVESSCRVDGDGEEYLFMLNHGRDRERITLHEAGWALSRGEGSLEGQSLFLSPLGTAILTRKGRAQTGSAFL
jgi:beta-galactosidase